MSNASEDTVPFPRLFEPISIGPVVVRNRIVNPTHGSALSEARDIRYIQERARGGAGLLGLYGSTGVANYGIGPGEQKSSPEWDDPSLSPVSDEGILHYDEIAIPYMNRRADVVHLEGAACFAQVYHLGSAPHSQRILPPVAPSSIGDSYDALSPHPLTNDEIEELIVTFAHGVRRIKEAGIDAAEIHGAHGYLVHEFLSPYFNRRTDKWGGTTENRCRFVTRILEESRRFVGSDFPIGIRVGFDGDGRRGIGADELVRICQFLAPKVDYFSISGGNYSGLGDGLETAYVSPWYTEAGYNVPASTMVRDAVDVPVIVTGRITDPSTAESILASGGADMIGMVRALIADPELPNKARSGKSLEVRGCLGMSECHYIGPHRKPINCAVNAAAGREKEMEIVPTNAPKKVVVVGAGPAGMEAARIAAMRGHEVYLCDKSREIGGTIRLLAFDQNRRNLRDHAAYFIEEFKKCGVNFMLGNEVTAEDLIEFGPDVVVIATGGIPLIPDVPGLEDSKAITALDLLSSETARASLRRRVLVVGGLDNNLAGPTMAEYLLDLGKSVELIYEQVDFATGAEDGTRFVLLSRLMNKGANIVNCHRLVGASNGSATVRHSMTGATRTIDDVSIVLACGLVPNDQLACEIKGRIAEIHLIGDALAPRRMMHATLEGARIGNLV
jgi:2,4-dienoyl-CoA reductase-like NADH-dependent reductase (Old Yellow Enzyme family)/thioredoxin reductase